MPTIDMSRRNFLKGAVLMAAGAVAPVMLTGCGNGRKHLAKDAEKGQGNAGAAEEPEFMKAPAAISDSQISSTIDTEVVVVGAGMAGLSAACAAAEEGAKVVLIEKTQNVNFRSYDYGAVNSKVQAQVGTKIDPELFETELMRYASYRANQKVIKEYTEKSGEANDWLFGLAQKAGCTVKHIWTQEELVAPTSTLPCFPTLTFVLNPPAGAEEKMPKGMYGGGPTIAMSYTLLSTAENLGVDIHYKTPAVQLIRPDNSGEVKGVIAQDENKQYIKINASKGVILCAGDYGHDEEMLNYFIPTAKYVNKISYPGTFNTGDGQKMGMWIGAAIDEGPHTAMYFDKAFVDDPKENPDALVRQPWLGVNLKGERFGNEDLPFGYLVNQVRSQPEKCKWNIWDSKWPEETAKFHQTACKEMKYHHNDKDIERYIEKGLVKKADSLQELAEQCNLPWDTFKATVERYNELAHKGHDDDFNKKPLFMTPLEKGPFFAAKIGSSMLVTLGGLQINEKMQVLDKDKNVIPHLYAAGNNSGSFFGNDYPTTTPGTSHGRAYTFGYLAGKNITKQG